MKNEALKSLREQQNLTQIGFSVRHDISVSVIQATELRNTKRTKSFSARIRQKLAEAYGVPIEEINAACGLETPEPATAA